MLCSFYFRFYFALFFYSFQRGLLLFCESSHRLPKLTGKFLLLLTRESQRPSHFPPVCPVNLDPCICAPQTLATIRWRKGIDVTNSERIKSFIYLHHKRAAPQENVTASCPSSSSSSSSSPRSASSSSVQRDQRLLLKLRFASLIISWT